MFLRENASGGKVPAPNAFEPSDGDLEHRIPYSRTRF